MQNDGHTVSLQGLNKCVDQIVTRYLVDGKAPTGDQKCAAEAPPTQGSGT